MTLNFTDFEKENDISCVVLFVFSLSSTKQRLIVRSGCKFTNPVLFYEQLKSVGRTTSQQRYASKVGSEFAVVLGILSATTITYLYTRCFVDCYCLHAYMKSFSFFSCLRLGTMFRLDVLCKAVCTGQ